MSECGLIAVVGSGAVGLYYGGRLAQHGADVHFLARSEYDALRQRGLSVKSCDGDFRISAEGMRVYRDPREMPGADLVIVALKSSDKETYRSLVSPLIKENTSILALQNGLGNEEKLVELFGKERVMGGIAFVCINRTTPGSIHHIAQGKIRIGELAGGISDRLQKLSDLFVASGVSCQPVSDLRWMRWHKLVWNIPFNALGAALDMTTDQLLASDDGLQLVTSIMTEVIDAARALGIELPADMIQQQLDYTLPMGPYKTSMQIDRHEGRAMEVESVLGEPLRLARAVGVPTPRLEMLYRMVSLGNLDNISGRR
jgi:2-dehydropantoate 2-reductase